MYVTHKSYGIKTNFTLSYTVVIRCKRQKIVCQKIEIKKQIYQFKNSSNFTFWGRSRLNFGWGDHNGEHGYRCCYVKGHGTHRQKSSTDQVWTYLNKSEQLIFQHRPAASLGNALGNAIENALDNILENAI